MCLFDQLIFFSFTVTHTPWFSSESVRSRSSTALERAAEKSTDEKFTSLLGPSIRIHLHRDVFHPDVVLGL